MGAGFARTFGAAVHGPIVQYGELTVCCRVDVELDNVGARSECSLHRGQGVLEVGVLGRVDAQLPEQVLVQPDGTRTDYDAALRELADRDA